MSLRVEPVTVIALAARNLRGAIMQGEFLPGEHLPEADLCRRMGISRASLREAMRGLTAEKLIEIIPNRGYFVARLDEADVADIGEVWTVLTTAAVGKFTPRAKPADLLLMRGAMANLQGAVAAGDVTRQLDAINEFFRAIYLRDENKVWSDLIAALLSRIHVLRRLSLRVADQASQVRQLEAILAAVTRRDGAAAMAATAAHIEAACDSARAAARPTGAYTSEAPSR